MRDEGNAIRTRCSSRIGWCAGISSLVVSFLSSPSSAVCRAQQSGPQQYGRTPEQHTQQAGRSWESSTDGCHQHWLFCAALLDTAGMALRLPDWMNGLGSRCLSDFTQVTSFELL